MRCFVVHMGCLWLLAGAAAAQSPPAGDVAVAAAEPVAVKSLLDVPLSMESRPYQVRLVVSADSAVMSSLPAELTEALERSVGALWQTRISELAGVSRRDRDLLARWSPADVEQRFQEDDVDVWFAVTIHDHGSRRSISVRAWQPKFASLSPVHQVSIYEFRESAGQVVQLCWGLFRPQILIEHVDQNDARIRIPAGDLQPADPAYRLFQPGDCLVPWLLYYDKNKAIQKRQELPWTYVRLDEIQGPLARGTVLSGLRTPLAGKTRGRIDKVAVAARVVYPQTKLQIGVQNQPARQLAGYRLELRPKLPERRPAAEPAVPQGEVKEEEPAEEEIQRLLTDRLGETMLSPLREHPLLWIFVYSGDLLLARVPIVPGSLPFHRLEVPDDSVRLQVEGDLQVLQNELINLVAERNTLIAAARGASKKGEWQRVVALRKSLDRLPTKQAYVERLGGIRVPALRAAKNRNDRNSQVRIDRLCKDVGELIDRYLDTEKLQLIKDDLDEMIKDAKVTNEEAVK